MSNIPLQHRLRVSSSPVNLALKQAGCELRVAVPAIVVANRDGQPFDADKQTVSVQPAVLEMMNQNGVPTLVSLPVLDDVPFQMPRSGGWALTFPIAVGDECLVVFADMAFDHWWESGGVQKQPDGKLYRHDIGDGVAIFGITSQPRALAAYSATTAQLRSDDGAVVIDLATGQITLNATVVSAVSGSGTSKPLVNTDFLNWFNMEIMPFLLSQGYTGAIPPATSATIVLKGE